jgi:protocatechuate 3,4-dioxygenase beta subunit
VRLLPLVFLVTLSLAQDPRPASLEGTVVNATTLEPLPGVQVGFLRQAPRDSSRTPARASGVVSDSNGRFRIDSIDPGDYRVTLRRDGFGIPRSAYSSLQLKVEPGHPITNLRFLMQPQAALTGRVLDDFGEPVSGAVIQLARRLSSGSNSSFLFGGGATTSDDRGLFRLSAIDPGRYAVQASHAEAREVLYPEPGGGVTAYLPTFAPSTADPQQAEVIDAQPGAESSPVTIRLRREPVFTVRGRALDAQGNPLSRFRAGFHPTASTFSPIQFSLSQTFPDGRFELPGVPAGTITITVIPEQSNARRIQPATTTVTVAQSDLDGVIVRTPPPQQLTGSATLEGGASPNWRDVTFLLRSGSRTDSNRLLPDGSFDLTYSAAGSGRIEIIGRPAPGAYLASIRSGSGELLHRDLPLDQGFPAPLRLLFRTGAGRIEGKLEGRNTAGAVALLWPADPSARDLQPLARTESNAGAFSFPDLAPGAYLLLAVSAESPFVVGRGETPPDLDQRATRVRVELNSTAPATLSVREDL